MLFDGYVEHVISSKVAISGMWSLTSFITSINNDNMENLKQMKILFETLACSITLRIDTNCFIYMNLMLIYFIFRLLFTKNKY